MPVLLEIITAVLIVSIISLTGVIVLWLESRHLRVLMPVLVGLATGSLLGAAFLDLLPEVLAELETEFALIIVLVGFVMFFILERFIVWYHWHYHWHHRHRRRRKAPFTYLNLLGDGVHNFIDGAIIAASFLGSMELGIIVTVAVIAHEIPQELGDFSVLVYGGFKPSSALFFNFLTALTALLGAIIAFFFSTLVAKLNIALLAFAAGGFIYLSAADLLPTLLHERRTLIILAQTLFFFIGVLIIFGLSFLEL